MYLSKKVVIDRFIEQFYIGYLISFYISTYFFYNPTAQNTWDFFQNNHYMESRYIFVVDMDYVDESNVHCEAYTVMYLRENRFVTLDHKTCHKGQFFKIEIYASSES